MSPPVGRWIQTISLRRTTIALDKGHVMFNNVQSSPVPLILSSFLPFLLFLPFHISLSAFLTASFPSFLLLPFSTFLDPPLLPPPPLLLFSPLLLFLPSLSLFSPSLLYSLPLSLPPSLPPSRNKTSRHTP